MSLATLKSKIELLIHKSTFGNIYEKIFKNEPLDLVIPDSVTVLCADQNIMYAPITTVSCTGADVEEITEMFFATTNIQSVNLPKVRIINNEAFSHCNALTEINMPLVTTIGEGAFTYCSALTEINLPALTTIGDNGFNSCTALTEINLPALTTIGVRAFSYCSALTEINMPLVTTIGADVIYITSKLTKMTVGALKNADPTSFKQTARGNNGTLTELYVGAGTSADLYLQYSTQYTQEILHGIIENLYDLSNGGKTGILCVGAKNLEKIDDEHKAMIENKNWELS